MSYQEPHDKSKEVKLVGKDYKGFKGRFSGSNLISMRPRKDLESLELAFNQNAEDVVQLDVTENKGLLQKNVTHMTFNDENGHIVASQMQYGLFSKKQLTTRTFNSKEQNGQKRLMVFLLNEVGLSPERLASIRHEAQYITDGRGKGLEAGYLKKVLAFLDACSPQPISEKPII